MGSENISNGLEGRRSRASPTAENIRDGQKEGGEVPRAPYAASDYPMASEHPLATGVAAYGVRNMQAGALGPVCRRVYNLVVGV